MKKLFNFRPIVLFTLIFVLGIIVSIFSENSSWLLIVSLILILILFFIFYLLFLYFTDFDLNKIILLFSTYLLAFVIGFTTCKIKINLLSKDAEQSNYYICSGEVQKISAEDNSYMIVLRDVELNNKSGRSCLNGSVYVFIPVEAEGSENIVVGSKIKFYGYYTYSLIDSNFNVKNFTNNISGYINFNEKSNIIIDDKINFQCKLKNYVNSLLNDNMTNNTSGIATAMLFGDTTEVDLKTLTDCREVGIAHLFAVSGLHIGFISTLIFWILTKLLKKQKLSAFFTIVVLFLYAWLCNFSSSVTRALVMMSILYISKITGKQYDGLCSLSLAAIIILLLSPNQLLSAGFLISFCVVLSIFEFAPIIKFYLDKVLTANISMSLSVCFASYIGSAPIMAYFFGNMPLASVLVNFMVIPVATIAFYFLFVGIIIVAMFPFCGVVLKLPQFLFEGITGFASFVGGFNNLFISRLSVSVFTILIVYILFFLSSDFSFIKKKYVLFLSSILLFAISLFI